MRQKPSKNQNLSEDLILWQRVIQNVKPLAKSNSDFLYSKQDIKNSLRSNFKAAKLNLDKTIDPIILDSNKELKSSPVDLRQGERAGLDGRSQKKLFRGEVSIDQRLDLHGFTVAQAESRLRVFIETAASKDYRCVLIITGKGTGILRGYVSDWLKRQPLSRLVLAIAQARPADGGSGAVYVLLRRHRK
jgi:DNA-nicking Smr family endonuclease